MTVVFWVRIPKGQQKINISMKKNEINNFVKGEVRKAIMADGGYDGRFSEKVVPDKKRKYNRQKEKKVYE